MHGRTDHELFTRHPDNPILSVRNWPYRANSVFNAAAAEGDGKTLLLVRVEDFRGHSHLTVARSEDSFSDWDIQLVPTLESNASRHPEDLWAMEDPRMTWLDGMEKWAACYTDYSKGGPLVAVAITTDFKRSSRLGPVMPPEDKGATLFPRPLQRSLGDTPPARTQVAHVRCPHLAVVLSRSETRGWSHRRHEKMRVC